MIRAGKGASPALSPLLVLLFIYLDQWHTACQPKETLEHAMLFSTSPRGRELTLADPDPPTLRRLPGSSGGAWCSWRTGRRAGILRRRPQGRAGGHSYAGNRDEDQRKNAEFVPGGKLLRYKPAAEGFHALAYGWVYDFDLVAAFTPQGSGTSVKLRSRSDPRCRGSLRRQLLLSVFPGVWVTHSMLSVYFSWYPGELAEDLRWYLPVSILPIPWVWKGRWTGRESPRRSGLELIERIRGRPGGEVDFRSVP